MCKFQSANKLLSSSWDGKAHTYAIVESLKPADQVTGLDLYIFVVRRRVDKKTKVTTCYVDVKSELLRDILRDVLNDIKGISLNESKLSVEQNLLYTTLPELELCKSRNEIAPLDQEGTLHLGLLVDYLRSAYADTTQSIQSLLPTGDITYDLLWALFKPNALVYTTCSGTHKPRCVRYNFGGEKKTMAGTKYWSLDCSYLGFNGEDLGLFPIELKIAKFRGAKYIKALEAFPLQYHAEARTVRADLLGCGRKFMSLRGTYHRCYNGSAFYVRDGQQVEVRIDGRIMVDAACFRKMNPNYFRPTASSEASSDDGSIVTSFDLASETSPDQCEGSVVGQAETTDEFLLICCPTVPGFSLRHKLWVEFAVADIKEIEWSSAPFDCLTLPDEQKETIMAVTETEASRDPDHEFDDFVNGKGRGVIVLLHGNPGVGKTLTAEAIAEHRQKPIYSISAGDLPTDTSQLESQLFKIFQVARHWDAILLLDEADVFLEKRAPKDIVRNGVVSVFLRTMEYCQGIMLLTTNRVTEFDPAALSRIHLKMKYDDLKSSAKGEVWRIFLSRACTAYGDPIISDGDLKRLSNAHFNGREIRNTIAIARKIAIKQKSIVLFSHLEKAVAASKEFLIEFNGPDHVSSVFL
ncbi:P-loop containing nucleoside triphosphate hydrolase protein [Hyaloscypha bicolor E]|uniref:P-loop containing nucleoside triphosphate hydrolase protein n=1 Tax=Hyaloscypha bicolor E TaxID=1095630 RepID=A0A2J6TB07_9HELO|nr:P-loop containing nucleoside triphosphate hydrolase protein [Hyaloscypha bicolor E]PMD60205.1 P-loop containing nucleoside triphosphate hydrolase protein [Hyaloscypha bicolor E]